MTLEETDPVITHLRRARVELGSMPYGDAAHFETPRHSAPVPVDELAALLADNLHRLRVVLVDVAAESERRLAELRTLRSNLAAAGELAKAINAFEKQATQAPTATVWDGRMPGDVETQP